MAGLDPDSRKMVIDSIGAFLEQALPWENVLEFDRKNEEPLDVIRQINDPSVLGLHLVLIPTEYGGMGGGAFDIYRVCETLAGMELGVATGVMATFLGLDPLRVGGTDKQKAKWMRKIAEQGLLMAYGASEPDAGSDLGSIQTRAVRVEKDGKIVGYRLNGSKQWITNGGIADLVTILAMAPNGPSWFIVEKGVEGFTYNKPEDKHGIRLSNTAGLNIEDVLLPADQLIGEVEGQGLTQAQAVFGYTRVMVAAFGLGAGWAALKEAVEYSQTRTLAGVTLDTKQGYTHKLLVPHAVDLEAARAYIEDVAEGIDGGVNDLPTEGAIAKYLASEAGNRAAEAAIQAEGGYGYTREYRVEKIKRDVRITCIYEGTSEVMEMTIARDRWQEHIKSRGNYYLEKAKVMDALHAVHPDVGAGIAAHSLRALAVVMENFRARRLTRNQHILFKLGELIAYAESAAVFSKAAAREEYSKAVRFDHPARMAMARLFARKVALKISTEGSMLVIGSTDTDARSMAEVTDLMGMLRSQKGYLADMDLVREKLIKTFPA